MSHEGYRQHTGLLSGIIDRIRNKKIAQEIQPHQHVLDLGCGPCLLTQFISTDCRYTGVDRDPHVIELNRRRFPQYSFSQVDFCRDQLPFEDGEFDVIVLGAVLEHVDDPRHMMTEVVRGLRPGGYVVATTPSAIGIWVHHWLADLHLASHDAAAEHKGAFTKKELELLLKEHRLMLERSELFEFGLNQLFVLKRGNE